MNRVTITLREIEWENSVKDVISSRKESLPKRKLKIDDMPTDVFSYADSRLFQHEILFSVLNIHTGAKLEHEGLSCWWCRGNISSNPIGEVIKKDKDTYYTDGFFCDWACLKAGKQNASSPLSAQLYFIMTGNQWSKIIEAPSWKLLKEYGGGLTRKAYENLKKKYKVVPLEGVYLSPIARMWEKLIN